ncbi:MAG TPA: hypothetical protein VE692_03380, partial [Nitrososphaera sp.]|nr:hypothetical protein [Nitrososphaera sp.]
SNDSRIIIIPLRQIPLLRNLLHLRVLIFVCKTDSRDTFLSDLCEQGQNVLTFISYQVAALEIKK